MTQPHADDHRLEPEEDKDSEEMLLARKKAEKLAESEGVHSVDGTCRFTEVFGDLPFCKPNADDDEALYKFIHDAAGYSPAGNACWLTSCCLFPVIGQCYILGKHVLIPRDKIGFLISSGVVDIMKPGRYWLANPLTSFIRMFSATDLQISLPPVAIITVPKGQIGLAMNGPAQELLLPGRHVRYNPKFKFVQHADLHSSPIKFGPIKVFTVDAGSAAVCLHNGEIKVFKTGRYAVNMSTFDIARIIDITQCTLHMKDCTVLLDGGVAMKVRGLLIYQVKNVDNLIRVLGAADMLPALESVTNAELARVFASIHLEQMARAQQPGEDEKRDPTVVGVTRGIRNEICFKVVTGIREMTAKWGVSVINFQLEMTRFQDEGYARDYEQATLKLAKVKVNQRAVETENQVKIRQAEAEGEETRIKADAQKKTRVLQAEAEAEARRIEAQSILEVADSQKKARIAHAEAEAEARRIESRARNDSAEIMKNDFARQFALTQQQVEMSGALKAQTVTVLGDSAIGKSILHQPLLAPLVPNMK